MTHVKTLRKSAAAMFAMCVALASSAITQTAAQAQASSALPIERDVLEKLPPDARAVLESLSPTRVGGADERGLVPVTREWDLTYGYSVLDGEEQLALLAAEPDLEGNVIIGGLASPDGGDSVYRILKIDGSRNGDAPPTGPIWQTDLGVSGVQLEIQTDLNGFIYVLVVSSPTSTLFKIAPSGGALLWSSIIPSPMFPDLAVEPNGTPFVAVKTAQNEIGLYRVDSLSGAIAWETEIRQDGNCFTAGLVDFPKITIDKQGDLWATVTGGATQFVWQIDPISGLVLQCGRVNTPNSSNFRVLDFIVAPDGRILSCGLSGSQSYFSILTTDLSQNPFYQIGGLGAREFSELEADRFGRVHAVGISTNGDYIKYLRLSPGLAAEVLTPNTADYRGGSGGGALTVDRAGNPYVSFTDGVAPDTVRTLRLDGSSLETSPVWTENITYKSSSLLRPMELLVDFGSNVYSILLGNEDDGATGRLYGAVVKYTQPYLSVPITYKSAATFQVEEAGLWSPDDPSFVYEYQFFDTGTASFDTTIGDTFEICYFVDCDDFGAQFGVDFDARLKSGFRAEANGGSFDAVVPVQIDMTVPSDQKLFPGKVIDPPIMTSWKMSPAARLTAAGSPTFNAGITGDLDGGFRLDYDVTVFSDRLVGGEIFDERLRLGPGYVPALNVQSLIHAFIGDDFVPGYTYEFEDARGFFGGDVRYPDLSAQGVFEQTPTGGIATSNAEDLLLELRANISEMAAAAAGATISLGDEYEYAGMNLEWEVAILQLIIRARFNLVQDFEVEFNTPEIEFSFSDGLPTQTITAGDPLSFPLPQDKDVVITPTVRMSATVRNTTGLNVVPGGSFTPIEAGAEIYYDAVFDEFEIYSFDIDHWVPSIDVNASPIGPLSLYTDDWTIVFPPVELDPIVMVTENDSAPKLSAASRESVSMLIYDQTNPQASQYNVLTNGSFKMLLYGEGLDLNIPGYNDSMTVHIAHQGAEVQLTQANGLRTLINRNTMLVEIPNYLRVIPGVARVWVTVNTQATGARTSETLDLAISYPRPRLDTVNPNLWAADPALLEVPISVIDGQSTIGLDTFIARRDYFVKLRDEFWNAARVGGTAADDFFSLFDFEQLPGFPLVLFDGRPLPRFEQPTDSGILNVRLPPSNYAAPGLVDVMLCNPGPGGGPSIVRELNIAAPRPVLSSVEPLLIAPDEGPVVLTIRGPSNVPFDPSSEEPKYGNLTADTQIFVDGVEVGSVGLQGVTRFNGPGSITIELDTADLQEGLVLVEAFTPANGTQYLEQVGGGLGLVDSGGWSQPIYLEVGYPRPAIGRLVPPSTIVNSTRMLEPGLLHNLSISGDNFRDDAVVYVNGQPRTTIFESDGLVRVLLEPLDLALPGMVQVAVESGGDVSTPALFFIDPAP